MAPLCFVLGAPRSGTTLLRVMLAGHSRLFSPPEMIVAPFTTMAERKAKLTERFWEKGGLRRAIMELEGCDVDRAKELEASLDGVTVPEAYSWLTARLGEKILVDKCPHLAADPVALERLLKWYPDAKWVWLIRHPGSVLRSVENMPMAEVLLQGYVGGGRDVWTVGNDNIKRFLAKVPDSQKVVVKYEDLVTDAARPALQGICDLLGIPFEESLLTPYEGDRMREGPPGARPVGDPNMAGRGKIDPGLATKWLEGFDPASVGPETHSLARELGYDLGLLQAPPISAVSTALSALLESVRTIEATTKVPADLDQVEGRRFLLRQLAHSIELFVDNGDPAFPSFHHAEGPYRKSFADSPDTDYLRAPIRTDEGRAWRVSGQVPAGTTYVGILLYRKGGQVGNKLTDTQFVRPDGSFEVVIATEPRGDGPFLQADGDETSVMVRQYFTDRKTQAPITLQIEAIGERAVPTALSAGDLARSIDKARRNLEAVVKRTTGVWELARTAALNRFVPMGGDQLFPTPDNVYQACWFRLGEDQLMVVKGRLPKARYVSFVVYNLWMESLDYDRRRVSLNHSQLKTGPDGSFEIVLAHADPGHPNWLDTGGHLAGYLLMRNLVPEGPVESPTAEIRYVREWR